MRAAVVERPGQVSVSTVDAPVPASEQVVVEVWACGICGTDLRVVDGAIPVVEYPVVPGHEIAGRAIALGPAVAGVAEGDLVAVDPSLPCGRCAYCRAGRDNLCERGGAIGISAAGGAAEYVKAPARNCYPLPPGTPAMVGALVEPLACAAHGLDRVPHGLTDHVLVYGAGTMGLLLVQLLRRCGVASLSVVDSRFDRLTMAEAMGANKVSTSPEKFDRAGGWELVVDATGSIAAIEDGLGRVRKGGTFLQIALADAATARFSPVRVLHDEITIAGSMAVHNTFDRARDLLVTGAVDVSTVVTTTVELEEFPAALADFRAGHGIKTQVVPAG